MSVMISSYLHDVKRELLLLEWQITNDAVGKKKKRNSWNHYNPNIQHIPSCLSLTVGYCEQSCSLILQLCKNYSKQEVNQEQVPMIFHSQSTILLKFLGLDGMIRRYDLRRKKKILGPQMSHELLWYPMISHISWASTDAFPRGDLCGKKDWTRGLSRLSLRSALYEIGTERSTLSGLHSLFTCWLGLLSIHIDFWVLIYCGWPTGLSECWGTWRY